jgi:hypothetical protein
LELLEERSLKERLARGSGGRNWDWGVIAERVRKIPTRDTPIRKGILIGEGRVKRAILVSAATFLAAMAEAFASSDLTNALEHFNYVNGTQTFGPRYQFTKQTRLVETAEAIHDLGCTVIKFGLGAPYARGFGNIPEENPAIHSLVELARDEPSHRHVFDMPFANFIFWMHTFCNDGKGWHNGFSKEAQDAEYREVYDLVLHLLKTYSGTGKTFYLGHWEGDGMMRGTVDKANDARVTPTAVQGMIDWLNVRQRAVDDAKRETPHHDIQVWHYTEVNHVVIARDEERPAVVNKVLPNVNVDFVSYSAYDTSNNPERENIKSALDYIESKLKPKPGIAGKRVFIGEYSYEILNQHTAQQQDELSRIVMRAGLEWGCPFVLYWEIYSNVVAPDGTQRGAWMIDDKGVKQPVYMTHKRFLERGRKYVKETLERTGKVPTMEEYRRVAVGFLEEGGGR